LVVLNDTMGLDISPETVDQVILLLSAWILGQSAVDVSGVIKGTKIQK